MAGTRGFAIVDDRASIIARFAPARRDEWAGIAYLLDQMGPLRARGLVLDDAHRAIVGEYTARREAIEREARYAEAFARARDAWAVSPGDALGWVERARGLDPGRTEAWVMGVRLLRQMGRTDEADARAAEAVGKFPGLAGLLATIPVARPSAIPPLVRPMAAAAPRISWSSVAGEVIQDHWQKLILGLRATKVRATKGTSKFYRLKVECPESPRRIWGEFAGKGAIGPLAGANVSTMSRHPSHHTAPRSPPMIVSEARIGANRRNALLSTGPKTPEGKERSRANALKHGLCSSVVVAEDARLVTERSRDFFQTLKPRNHFHCWLVTEIALLSLRIERCERIERRVRDKVALRAELSWDDDRRLESAVLGESLASRPDVVSEQLRRTPHGCEWLMTRWAMLAHSADLAGGWTPEQGDLAFDLLGTPAAFRVGHQPGASLDFEGHVVGAADDPAAVARREVAALQVRREVVSVLDEANRSLAGADLSDDLDPELRRLRRYESTLHGRLRWCLAQLRYESPHGAPLPGLMRIWLGQQEPAPDVEPATTPPAPEPRATTEPEAPAPASWLKAIHPPVDLEPHEVPRDGEEVALPTIFAARRRRKLEKAQSRREARRRKLEQLRA